MSHSLPWAAVRAAWQTACSAGELERKEAAMIDWRTDVDAALEEAEREDRPVLLDFTAAPL